VVAAVGLVVLLARPDNALGHAALVRSEPGANAFLKLPPSDVTLVFSESVDARSSTLRVLDARGQPVAASEPVVLSDGATFRATLPKLPPGIYNVLWSNVSNIDGHALLGSFPFTVLNPDGSLPGDVNTVASIGSGNDPPPETDGIAVRSLALLGLALAAGGALVLLVARDGLARAEAGLRWTVLAGAGVLVIANALNLAIVRDVYSRLDLMDVVFHTRTGGYWLARFDASLFMVGACLFLRPVPRWAAGAILLAVVVFLWSYSATSHAAAGAGSFWATAFDMGHGLAAIAWIGAVTGLVIAARLAWRDAAYGPVMARFSLLASLMVFVLLATGTLGAFVEVDSPDRLANTRWGVTLVVKLGLALPLLALALYNAKRGRARLVALLPGEPRRFVLTAGGEALLGIAVFAAAAILTQTTVSKSVFDLAGGRPFDQQTAAEGLNARLQVDPNRTGLNTYSVALSDAPASPVDATRVRLTFRYRDDQTVGPATLPLAPSGTPGRYVGQGPFLTLEGQWRVEVEVRRPDVNDVRLFFDVRPAGLAVSSASQGGAWSNPAPGLSWNQFGGIVVLLGALGLALFKRKLPATPTATWVSNGMTLFGFGIAALLLFGVHSHTSSSGMPSNPIYPDQDSISRGRALFQQNCAACHGQNGVPPGGLALNPYPLDLTVHAPLHPDGQLFQFISKGVPGSAMRAWSQGPGNFSDDQIWHLVNFLRTLGQPADR
jgi:copper transport protein